MWKHCFNNRIFSVGTTKVIILAGYLGVIATGCTNVAQANSLINDNNTQNNPSSSVLLNDGGRISNNCQGDDKPCVSDLFEPTTEPLKPVKTTNIEDGNYITGIGLGIDPRIGLEVLGNQYRYYDEYENKEWRDIRELKFIKQGLIFDGQEYWCNPPNSDDGACTKNGWEKT